MTNCRSIFQDLLSMAACVAALGAVAPVQAQTSGPKIGADLATSPAAEDATIVGGAMFFPFAEVSVVPAQRQTEGARDVNLEEPDLTLTTIAGLTGIAALGFVQRRARYGSAQTAV